MIDRQNFYDQSVKNDLKTYNNIRKLRLVKEMTIKLIFLLDYPFFKKHKMIAIDLINSKRLMLIRKQYNRLILL